MPSSRFKSAISLSSAKKGSLIALLSLSPEEYESKIIRAASHISEFPGIYASFAKLWREIDAELSKRGSDTSKLYWIGGTGMGFWSQDESIKGKTMDNVSLLEGPTALTHLSRVIDLLAPSRKYHYVLIDSLDELFAHNNEKAVLEFIGLMSKKLRTANMSAIYVCKAKGGPEKLSSGLSRLCDNIFTSKDL